MDHLRKTAKIDVALQTKPIYGQDPDLVDFKFLYMHGRGNFTLTPQAIKNFLRAKGAVTHHRPDGSNTQFAMLALWVARRHGMPVDEAYRCSRAERLEQDALRALAVPFAVEDALPGTEIESAGSNGNDHLVPHR